MRRAAEPSSMRCERSKETYNSNMNSLLDRWNKESSTRQYPRARELGSLQVLSR